MNQVADKNKVVYQSLASVYFILYFVLFFVVSRQASVEISLEKMLEPFLLGGYILLAYLFLFLVVVNVGIIRLFLIRAKETPRYRLITLVLPEISAILGFVLGFLTLNVSVAVPFVAFGLLMYVYVYKKLGL